MVEHAAIPDPLEASASSQTPSRLTGLALLALATWTLWQREVVGFLRQRSRVIGGLGVPVVFWVLLGSGLNETFRLDAVDATAAGGGGVGGVVDGDGVGYMAYFFPGTIVMIVLFTAIFSTISVIEDRRAGFLQGVLVSPAPRLAIVLGKTLGGATLAFGQAVLFLLAWPWVVSDWPTPAAVASVLAATALLGVMLTALGLCIAWPMRSTAGFHAIMNLLLMPMWFLCGALFPVATAPLWMRVVMYANPLTYGHTLITDAMLGPGRAGDAAPPAVAWAVSVAATVALLLWLTRMATRPSATGR